MKIKLGSRVTDRITGFTGIAIARTDWLTGCVRFGVQSEELHNGKPIGAEWFDEDALVKAKKRKGGPPAAGVETG
jgi:hypothetical protein